MMVSRGMRRVARALLGVSVLMPAAWAQESAPIDELGQTLRELRRLRADYYVDKRATEASIEQARADVAKLESDVADIEGELRRGEESASSIRQEIGVLQKEKADLQSRAVGLSDIVGKFAARARDHIRAGIPYRIEGRLASADAFADADSASEALALMWAFFEEEMRIARTGEVYTDEVPVPSGRKHARVVRVGKLVLAFVSEDGLDIGVWVEGTGWTPARSEQEAESVRAAIEILERRRVPEHVVLPVSVRGGSQ